MWTESESLFGAYSGLQCNVRAVEASFLIKPSHLSTSSLWLGLVIAAMYCMMYLLASVFPAPLSPGNHTQIGAQNADHNFTRVFTGDSLK